MSDEFYRPSTGTDCAYLQSLDELAQNARQVAEAMQQAAETYQLLGLKPPMRVMRAAVRPSRRVARIADRMAAYIRRNQRWWAADEKGGWCYPWEVWYSILAQMDQVDAAAEDACRATQKAQITAHRVAGLEVAP